MKREFLKELNLTDEQIDAVMAQNGKDIEAEKGKFADYEDIKSQLKAANDKIESFGDVDAVKAEVEKYKADYKALQDESAKRIAHMELMGKIKTVTSAHKFVNDYTREALESSLESAVNDPSNKGKSLEELFSAMTDGKDNIFVSEGKPTAPVVPTMQTDKTNPASQTVTKTYQRSFNQYK